jgi:hypothetical protein
MPTLTPEQYWKLRAHEADRLRVEESAKLALMNIEAARKADFAELGLSLKTRYVLNDDTCTVEEATES